MTINKEITLGNIVSWSMIAVAFILGFGKLKAQSEQALITSTAALKESQVALTQNFEVRLAFARLDERLKAIDDRLITLQKDGVHIVRTPESK